MSKQTAKEIKEPFLRISPFLEAVIIASNRSRNVLLILSTASILALIGVINTRPFNWMTERISFTTNNIEFLRANKEIKEKEQKIAELTEECRNSNRLAAPTPTPTTRRNTQTVNSASINTQTVNISTNTNTNSNSNWRNSSCEQLHTLNNEVGKLKENIADGRFRGSREFYGALNKDFKLLENPNSTLYANELKKVETDLEILLKMRREAITYFKIPFFGTNFDINDLIIVSGITFIVILIWLRLSLWTELNSTHQVFERVDDNELIDCYEYLSMYLVFTIPKTLDSDLKKFGEKQWKWIMLLLMALPLITHFLVLANDLFTISKGTSVSIRNTMLGFILGFAALVAITLLTISCLSLTVTINRLWREQGKKINDLKMMQQTKSEQKPTKTPTIEENQSVN